MTAAFDPVHTGEVLAERLEALDMTAAAAARALGIPQSRLSQILNEHRKCAASMCGYRPPVTTRRRG